MRFPPSCGSPPFPWRVWHRLPTCDRCEIRERQRIFSSVSFSTYSQCQIPFCYTGRRACAGATYPCCAIRERVMIDSICEDKLYRTSKFADAVRYNVPRICATRVSPRGPSLALWTIHLVSRLRRVNRMCSSTLSVNCEKAEKDTLR